MNNLAIGEHIQYPNGERENRQSKKDAPHPSRDMPGGRAGCCIGRPGGTGENRQHESDGYPEERIHLGQWEQELLLHEVPDDTGGESNVDRPRCTRPRAILCCAASPNALSSPALSSAALSSAALSSDEVPCSGDDEPYHRDIEQASRETSGYGHIEHPGVSPVGDHIAPMSNDILGIDMTTKGDAIPLGPEPNERACDKCSTGDLPFV